MNCGRQLLGVLLACALGCGGKATAESNGGSAASSSSDGSGPADGTIGDDASSAGADGSTPGIAGNVLGGATCGGPPPAVAGEDVLPDGTLTNEDSGCADTQADPHNCGTCGHDCLGGACSGGTCQPAVLVAVPSPGIGSFAVDATSVYWTRLWTGNDAGPVPTNGIVAKCPINGGTGSPTMLATGQDFPESILVSGSTLYWLDYNAASLMQCSVDCNDDSTTFQRWWPYIWSGGFAASATEVFFSGGGLSGYGLVQQCPVGGCSTPTTFASQQQTPSAMVISGADLYWIDRGTMLTEYKDVSYVDGGVMTCPVDGCDGGPTPLATGLSYPNGLVVSRTKAYFAQGSSVLACSVTGCNGAPTTIVSLPTTSYDGIEGFAVDATAVYFEDAVQGPDPFAYDWEIRKCSLDGCPNGSTLLSSTPYVSGGSGPVPGIVVDATRIYFVSGDAIQILALAK
jgi:hypothetical protein